MFQPLFAMRGTRGAGSQVSYTPRNRKSLILLDFRDINFLDAALQLRVALLLTCPHDFVKPGYLL